MSKGTTTAELYCANGCGWLDPKWRACPVCGERQAKADRIDKIETGASAVALLSGIVMIICAFLPWATIVVPGEPDQQQGGMIGGVGVGFVIIGIIAAVVGGFGVANRRFDWNRPTLIISGVAAGIYIFMQRRLVSWTYSDMLFNTPEATMTYTFAMWLLLLCAVGMIVAGIALPSQLRVKVRPVPLVAARPDPARA